MESRPKPPTRLGTQGGRPPNQRHKVHSTHELEPVVKSPFQRKQPRPSLSELGHTWLGRWRRSPWQLPVGSWGFLGGGEGGWGAGLASISKGKLQPRCFLEALWLFNSRRLELGCESGVQTCERPVRTGCSSPSRRCKCLPAHSAKRSIITDRCKLQRMSTGFMTMQSLKGFGGT